MSNPMRVDNHELSHELRDNRQPSARSPCQIADGRQSPTRLINNLGRSKKIILSNFLRV
jgi:hypothetical protein